MLNHDTMTNIQNRLSESQVRSQYKKALVYKPTQQKYVESSNRESLKATFFDDVLVDMIQQHTPSIIDIPHRKHIDIIHYDTGQYFNKHTDFVNMYPHYAQQVTIIIGLQNTEHGGTRLYMNGTSQMYDESIRYGGLLIFLSTIPHSGDIVVGEKEILVMTGYLFERRVNKLNNTLSYCQKVNILAIHKIQVSLNMSENAENNNLESSSELPLYYIYINQVFVAIYDSKTDKCYRRIIQGNQCQLQNEQLKWMSMPYDTENIDDPVQSYPLLRDMLSRKNILDCFRQCKVHNEHMEIKYTYETEFCNGYDDYDVVKIPNMALNTYCQHFSMAFFDERYYTYWLNKWRNNVLPKHIVHFILEYVVL